jgi:superfamily I DNA/RNA helicase
VVHSVDNPAQSIYSFLNGPVAAQSNFEQFTAQWPDARLIKLAKNFRSQV